MSELKYEKVGTYGYNGYDDSNVLNKLDEISEKIKVEYENLKLSKETEVSQGGHTGAPGEERNVLVFTASKDGLYFFDGYTRTNPQKESGFSGSLEFDLYSYNAQEGQKVFYGGNLNIIDSDYRTSPMSFAKYLKTGTQIYVRFITSGTTTNESPVSVAGYYSILPIEQEV